MKRTPPGIPPVSTSLLLLFSALAPGCALAPPGGEDVVGIRGAGLELHLLYRDAAGDSTRIGWTDPGALRQREEDGWTFAYASPDGAGTVRFRIRTAPGRLVVEREEATWSGRPPELHAGVHLRRAGRVRRLPDGPEWTGTAFDLILWDAVDAPPGRIELLLPRERRGVELQASR